MILWLLLLTTLLSGKSSSSKKKTTTALVPGSWGQWGPWEASCSKTCGIGVRRRTRTCSYTGRDKAKRCKGNNGQLKNCVTEKVCPVHGGWAGWTAWQCTVTCGGGDGKQKRTCSNPKPKNGGKDCEGPAEEEGKCNTQKCPDEIFTLSPMTAQAIKSSIDNEHYNFQKNEGETVQIPCSATVVTKIYEEYPTTTLMWTKNGQVIKTDHKRMKVLPTELTIEKLVSSDNGVYVCSVNYAPQVVRPVTVAAVTVTASTPDVKIPAEESMKLLCHGAQLAKIYKNSTQKWLLNNKVYKDFGSDSPMEHSVYEIEDVKPNMTGIWSCQIQHPLTGKTWITNEVSVKVLPAIPKFLRFLTSRNVLLTIGIVLFVLVMLVGTFFGYVIIKTREEFMAEFEKWSQIANWEEIKAGGRPQWALEEEVEMEEVAKVEERQSETDGEI